MRSNQIFKRREMKYLISSSQKTQLQQLMADRMIPDEFGKSTIFNLYCDTEDFRLIRRSLDKPVYKEKLRLHSYGPATADSPVFLELKKKYRSVVYKRRICLSQAHAMAFLQDGFPLPDGQIERELSHCHTLYPELLPRVFISYDREAFFGAAERDFRITFDENILWRQQALSLNSEAWGEPMLPREMTLLEIKVNAGLPLWLTHFLSDQKIYKTSFSKYGNAYQIIRSRKGGSCYAA